MCELIAFLAIYIVSLSFEYKPNAFPGKLSTTTTCGTVSAPIKRLAISLSSAVNSPVVSATISRIAPRKSP